MICLLKISTKRIYGLSWNIAYKNIIVNEDISFTNFYVGIYLTTINSLLKLLFMTLPTSHAPPHFRKKLHACIIHA